MESRDIKILVGYGLAAAGIIGFGAHDFFQSRKVNKSLEKFGVSMDDIARRTEVDIADSVVREAVNTAAKDEAKRVVGSVGDAIKADIRKDMHSQVETAVSSMFYSVQDEVKSLMKKKVGDMSNVQVEQAKRDIIEMAKDKIADLIEDKIDELFDSAKEDLDDKIEDFDYDARDKYDRVLERYENRLKDTQEIYGSVHRAMGDR